MKIRTLLVIIPTLEVGGAENHLCQILPGLKAKGWDITVYLTVGPGELIAKLENAGIKVIQPSIYFLPLTFVQLCWHLLREQRALVQFVLPRAYLLGGLACILTRQPRLVMNRRSLNNYQQKYPLLSKLEKWLHTKMACIITNNRQALEQLTTEEQVPEQKIRLIYNGVDTKRFDQLAQLDPIAIRQQFALAPSALTLIVIANIIPYKGHATLLEALALIQDQLPSSWQLLCVGAQTDYLQDLQHHAIHLDLSNNVRWLGKQATVDPLLAIADIAICCSYEEGFSNAILEAMAAGLPVVATQVGGNPEAVVDGETGLLVPERNAVQLSQAILKLALDPAVMAAMGEAGKKRVRKFFSVQECINEYDSLCYELANT